MGISFSNFSTLGGGNDSGGTVIASASNNDSAQDFYLIGPFPVGDYIVEAQAEPNKGLSILALDSSNNVQQTSSLVTGSSGAGSAPITLAAEASKIAITGLAGYVTILSFEAEKTNISVGPIPLELTSSGIVPPLYMGGNDFINTALYGQAFENNTHWFVPSAGGAYGYWYTVSKANGYANSLFVIPSGSTIAGVRPVTYRFNSIGVKDNMVVVAGSIGYEGVTPYDDVLIFRYNSEYDAYICDMNEASDWRQDVLPIDFGSTAQNATIYVPSQQTFYARSSNNNAIVYSTDDGATWTSSSGFSSNYFSLVYDSQADALLSNAPDNSTYGWYYISDITDPTSSWSYWAYPSSNFDYYPPVYNSVGGFWTIARYGDNNSLWTASSLGGSWTHRSIGLLQGGPSQPASHNGYTVVMSNDSNPNNYTGAYSTDGTSWTSIFVTTGYDYMGNNLTTVNNGVYIKHGDKVSWIGASGGFTFDTSIGERVQPAVPLGITRQSNDITWVMDPTGQYLACHDTSNGHIAFSGDYGASWHPMYISSLRHVHWFANSFYTFSFSTSPNYVWKYNASTNLWTGLSGPTTGTYNRGMTVFNETTAVEWNYSTSGFATLITDPGDGNWSRTTLLDWFVYGASNDAAFAYALNTGGNIYALDSTYNSSAGTVVTSLGQNVILGGVYNERTFSIPYKDGIIYYAIDQTPSPTIYVSYIVNGIQQNTNNTSGVSILTSEAGISGADADAMPVMWEALGILYLEITLAETDYGKNQVYIWKSSDDAATWTLLSVDSFPRNFPINTIFTFGYGKQGTNQEGNGDYDAGTSRPWRWQTNRIAYGWRDGGNVLPYNLEFGVREE